MSLVTISISLFSSLSRPDDEAAPESDLVFWVTGLRKSLLRGISLRDRADDGQRCPPRRGIRSGHVVAHVARSIPPSGCPCRWTPRVRPRAYCWPRMRPRWFFTQMLGVVGVQVFVIFAAHGPVDHARRRGFVQPSSARNVCVLGLGPGAKRSMMDSRAGKDCSARS